MLRCNVSTGRSKRKSNNNLKFLTIGQEAIEKSKSEAVFARDNLVVKKNGGHAAKVCCICDKFIMFGRECSVKVYFLKKTEVGHRLRKGQNILYSRYNVSNDAQKAIDQYYTVKCSSKYAWLRKL